MNVSKQEFYIFVVVHQRVLAIPQTRALQVRVRLHELRMCEHARLAIPDRQPARTRDAVRGRTPILRLVRREEARADGQQ